MIRFTFRVLHHKQTKSNRILFAFSFCPRVFCSLPVKFCKENFRVVAACQQVILSGRTMRQYAHGRYLAEVLWQGNKPLGTNLHGRTRFVSPLCGMSKKNGTESELLPRTTKKIASMKNAKGGLKENHERAKSGRSPERFSGDRPFPCAFEFRFLLRCFVCGGCLNGEAKPSRSFMQAPATVPKCVFAYVIWLKKSLICDIILKNTREALR